MEVQLELILILVYTTREKYEGNKSSFNDLAVSFQMMIEIQCQEVHMFNGLFDLA